jgi:hypothetical protein
VRVASLQHALNDLQDDITQGANQYTADATRNAFDLLQRARDLVPL